MPPTDRNGGRLSSMVKTAGSRKKWSMNKPVRIRKYEWNADGTKKKQYNYAPNGKLQSVKVFEYVFTEP